MAFSFILDLWNKWNIRSFVVLSLSLQVLLILFAPLRKKTANRLIISFLWLAYLMADSVAAFAVGLISHNQYYSNAHVAEVNGALQGFWASFLLLHLGGPDTITAFSLEDSSLWRRHLLSLIFQVNAAIYVFVRIFPSNKSLVIPTILVFLAGAIKISERTLALYLSSFPKLRESMLLDSERRMATQLQVLEELKALKEGYKCSDGGGAKLDESIVVKHAYSFFQIFKVFIVDLVFTKQQRKTSREYFDEVSAMDALRVISVELNFIYEELHTKAMIIRHKGSYIFRIVAFASVMVALGLFNRSKKHQFLESDVKITYILLFGGIILDGIALFMLVFSDWTVVGIKNNTTGSSKLDSFLYKLVSATDYLRKPRYTKCVGPNAIITYEVLDTLLIFRRWSESVFACNLFSEALNKNPRKICKSNWFWGIVVFKDICSFPFRVVDNIISYFHQAGETIARCFGKGSMIVNVKYMSKNLFDKKLWIFIFDVVKSKSQLVDNPETVRLMINTRSLFTPSELDPDHEVFKQVTKAHFDIWALALHIATEILYNIEEPSKRNDEMEFSKILSDYLLYLLLKRPNVLSAVMGVGHVQMRSGETLLQLRHLITRDATKDLKGICEKLHSPPAESVERGLAPPSESALGAGALLAQAIGVGEDRWNNLSRAWVDMLAYAASNIKGEAHVQALSKGGELLAFVWTLMAHFGCLFNPQWGLYYEFWDEQIES